MDANSTTIVLRLIHILAGTFWVGAIFLLAGFLVPTARSSGPEGGRFMQQLMLRRRLPVFLGVAMLLTVLSGLVMYVRVTAATHGAWPARLQASATALAVLQPFLGPSWEELLAALRQGKWRRLAGKRQRAEACQPSRKPRCNDSRRERRSAHE